MSGYHVTAIKKSGILSPYKLVEESIEFVDALASGNKIMAMVELSDLYGAIKQMSARLNISLEDLDTMSESTIAAFKDRTRAQFGATEKSWSDWIFANYSDMNVSSKWVRFTVLGDQYVIFTDTSFAPTLSSSILGNNHTHILELLIGEACGFAGRKPLKIGNVYHQENWAVECQKGSIIRITSTPMSKRPATSKGGEQERCSGIAAAKAALGV